MSSSLTRLFKKKDVLTGRHGNEVEERGPQQPANLYGHRVSDASMKQPGGTRDEYADPWDVRNNSVGSMSSHSTTHSGLRGNALMGSGGGPVSAKSVDDTSYSSPFNTTSRPQSPKAENSPFMSRKPMGHSNDDYQDPFDSRLRQGSTASLTSSVHHGAAGEHRSAPARSGVVSATTSLGHSDYNTPADALGARQPAALPCGTAMRNDNYSLPADTLRNSGGAAVASGGNVANSQYSTPRDAFVRPQTSDGALPTVASASGGVLSDYSNPADHIPDLHARTLSAGGRNHYIDFRASTHSGGGSHESTSTPTATAGAGRATSDTNIGIGGHHPPPVTGNHPMPLPGDGHHLSGHCGGGKAPRVTPELPENNHVSSNTNQRDMLRKCNWFHGAITRDRAEMLLRAVPDCSFLVRVSESSPTDFSLSVRNSGQPLHLKIIRRPDGTFVLGQNSKPFQSIIDMIQYYERHKLLIKGAEHIFLEYVIARS